MNEDFYRTTRANGNQNQITKSFLRFQGTATLFNTTDNREKRGETEVGSEMGTEMF